MMKMEPLTAQSFSEFNLHELYSNLISCVLNTDALKPTAFSTTCSSKDRAL